MDISALSNSVLNAKDLAATNRLVELTNAPLNNGKGFKKVMGQPEFLQLLTEEFKNQDPTQPLKDREFIAQMAQISQLDQVNNMTKQIASMNREINNVSKLMQKNNAFSLLGKIVDIVQGGQLISGKVEEIKGGDFPQLLVNGKYYNYQNVRTLKNSEGE
jgi:flagellar basal-body rod modification protein FlgD